MDWDFELTLGASERAALDAGKNLIYVSLPAGWAVEPLFRRLPAGGDSGMTDLFLVPEVSEGLELSHLLNHIEPLAPAHPVTALDRTTSLLKRKFLRSLVATPADALLLISGSALRHAQVSRITILWPELQITLGHSKTLDSLLAEHQNAQRLLITSNETAIADFVERHARRAPVARPLPPPEKIPGRLRYVVTSSAGRVAALHRCLDMTNPDSVLIWEPDRWRHSDWRELAADPAVTVGRNPGGEPVHLAVAADLPDTDVLKSLMTVADEVVVLVRPGQLTYLLQIVEKARPLKLPSEADRARDSAFRLRNAVRRQLASPNDLSFELSALEPLFYEHDPALIAAASLTTLRETLVKERESVPSWVRVYVSAGRRDSIRPADLVGVLLNSVGLHRGSVGRIDIRDTFTLVEVEATDADRAIKGLTGTTIRGRRVTARLDRK